MRTLPLAALTLLVLPLAAHADADPAALRQAVERGLKRLEEGAANYTKHRQCFACHHQSLTLAAVHSARKRGFAIDADKAAKQLEFTLATFKPKLDRIRKGESIGGATTTAGYALFTLEVAGHPRDEVTDALVEYILKKQRVDGSWPAQANRPPSEGSPFTSAAVALQGLRSYGPPAEHAKAAELRKRIAEAIERTRGWLEQATPATTEDKVMRLRALVHAGADRKQVEAARDALAGEQRADGSWSQLPDREGDAYATGTVLLALRLAGTAPTEDVYRRGVAYLVKTQRPDGAWIVETRSRPIQVFFDNGDPGGKSQFISFLATGWAVAALLETVPVR
jgi:N-acyl-D-amino-acid deacylase